MKDRSDAIAEYHRQVAADIAAGQRLGISRTRLTFRESAIPFETRPNPWPGPYPLPPKP